jgi:hypothetical protein
LNPSKELCLYNSFQVLSQTLFWENLNYNLLNQHFQAKWMNKIN